MPCVNYKEKLPAAFPKLLPGQMAQIAEVAECCPPLLGREQIEQISVVIDGIDEKKELNVDAVSSFAGVAPRTEWLLIVIEKDAKDFIERGSIIGKYHHWKEKRRPSLLETARSGVFTAGDVRNNFLKCVSSAVGKGFMAVQFVHEYLERFLNCL